MNINGLLVLLVIHTLISLIFFIVNIPRNGFQDSVYKFIVVFFIPVFGFLFLLISAIIRKTVKKSGEELEDFLRSVSGGKHIYHEEAIDFEKEINTVPLEDSLEFSDNKTKRAYLIYILKKDFTGHVKSLKKAIKSNDSETSHYAAAALMEIRKEFEIMLQNAEEKYIGAKKASTGMSIENGDAEVPSDDLETVSQEYAAVLRKYLRSNIADRVDYYDYMGKYSEILESLIDKDKSNQQNFIDKISIEIKLDDMQGAFEYCKLFAKYHPESENAYLSFLRLFYATKDYISFNKVVSLIKEKKIPLSEKSLNQLAFWEGSQQCS
jgi:hypothetical protein